MAESRIKSIKDLIVEPRFFGDKNVTPNSVLGLSIGYLMEETKIPDFTLEGYDYNSTKTLRNYADDMNKILVEGRMWKFFDQITTVSLDTRKYKSSQRQEVIEKYKFTMSLFNHVLEHNLDSFPAKLYDAFRNIILYEPDKERKTELQLMELMMLSRLPSQGKKNMETRFRCIKGNYVPERLNNIYDKASFYFL